jgi:hypothetical protein
LNVFLTHLTFQPDNDDLAKPSDASRRTRASLPKADGKGKRRYSSAEMIDDLDDEGPANQFEVPKPTWSAAAPDTESEYEREKRENVERNRALLKDVQGSYAELIKDLGRSLPSGSKPKAGTAMKSLEDQLVSSLSKVCSSSHFLNSCNTDGSHVAK